VGYKEKIQKIVFPEGVHYDFKKEQFRTTKLGEWFSLMPLLNSIPEDDNNKQGSIKAALSSLVGKDGQMPNQLINNLREISSFYELYRI
ncbi:MAG: hypothetical protein JST09_17730, partial [Bacteroidetes bacterium]|nr:hypothetical protein [Bacteroidota bacterium]